MSTGYTNPVKEGQIVTLTDYALKCAHAWGANIALRDTPDAPIPDAYEASPWYAERLEKSRQHLAEVLSRTPGAWAAAKVAAEAEMAVAEKQSLDAEAVTRERYEAMLAKVRAWPVPSSEHETFKAFMEEQLVDSIKFDCGGSGNWFSAIRDQTLDEYIVKETERAERDLERDRESLVDEQERVAGRNQWNRVLRESLEALPENPVYQEPDVGGNF